MKFGGTSVGTAERIKNVGKLITREPGNLVVLSAMSGTTNSLVEIGNYLKCGNVETARECIGNLREKYSSVIDDLLETSEFKTQAKDVLSEVFSRIMGLCSGEFGENEEKILVAQGEILSTNLMTMHLQEKGVDALLLSALDFMTLNDDGTIDAMNIRRQLLPLLEEHKDRQIFITQGFICRDSKGRIDNLKRGGSDYTASLIGAALNADEIEIWTDIDGMHNNDPRFVKNTRPVNELSFDEAAELAYFGAKILHPTCVLPAKMANIPVRLLNTMQPEAKGTLIHNRLQKGSIKAVAAKDGITAIKIKSGRMLLAYGFLRKVFEIFEAYSTPIDMVVTSEVGVSVTIDNDARLDDIVRQLKKLGTVSVEKDMVIICVVGDLEWQNCGFESKALAAFRDIPVRMISYGGSNFNISFLIDKKDKTRALKEVSAQLFD